MAPSTIRTTLRLLSLLLITQLASTLQVAPNSPCSSACVDSTTLDFSDPNSSNTRNSDITCHDAAYGTTETGMKWKNCMSCLQNSTYSQGSESDQQWFLYNARYAVAYCVFAFPNATGVGTTPCSTSMACGPLKEAFEYGILTPNNMTDYGYCSAGDGSGSVSTFYEKCGACVSAEGITNYLANYAVAAEAGCLQKPSTGSILGLNASIFSNNIIHIVDPATLVTTPNNNKTTSGLPSTIIAAIVVVTIAILLIISGVLFVWRRKRSNRRARAEGRFGRHRPKSSMSFQCQTQVMSPRFWPGVGGDAVPAIDPQEQHPTVSNDSLGRRHSLWKPHNAMSSFQNISSSVVTTTVAEDQVWGQSPYAQPPDYMGTTHGDKKTLVPLHHITTTSLPAAPAHAHMSPSTASEWTAVPMSADSVRSTAALLPAAAAAKNGTGFKPYVPSEHGVHASPVVSVFGNSPVSASTASPLLRNYGWDGNSPRQMTQQQQKQARLRERERDSNSGLVIPPPPPPPPKSPRHQPGSPIRMGGGGGGGGGGGEKEQEQGEVRERQSRGELADPDCFCRPAPA
ncbi:hypothetical protein QBC46DRAFT_65220 [Diplogelasinospora grovesii]|uniref:LPXTG-domain-containing protein n=1 Tax=Diplogelasinospora grovesii TaxID=303347 RepID=A0AAN6SAI7_9PEZI|nr:hypothetical protein QBC46DRAFT_65220 [Diplogelasinospora grovesii]